LATKEKRALPLLEFAAARGECVDGPGESARESALVQGDAIRLARTVGECGSGSGLGVKP
jgi:hypothetical protein